MTMIVATPRSLEDVRNRRYETVEEFTRFLGISELTYRRLLRKDPTVQNPTKRQIAERLGTPPHLITELIPPPSEAYIEALTTAIRDANQHGWYEYDLETGTIATTPMIVECPPGEMDETP
jgi:transcriptional regulator with XRE-family HTH domain